MTHAMSSTAKAARSTRWPVKRAGAESYLIISVSVFALTVVLTRLYLQLTGYPQLGNGVLHIAHALWGGLLLIIAALVPLILANGWALALAAALSGAGVGLFIDEIGKFITQRNDYFFPPAAPVIYGFFLILVFLLLVVRRTGRDEPRDELYRALMDLRELVDNNLDAHELQVLQNRLAVARQADQPEVAGLAAALQDYLHGAPLSLLPARPSPWQRATASLQRVGQRVGRRRHRILITAAMALLAFGTVLGIGLLLVVAQAAHSSIAQVLGELLTQDEIASANNGLWFYLHIGLNLLVSIIALAAVILVLARRERAGMRAALVALLVQLTGGTLLTFYLNQFGAVATALFQFLVLLMVVAYQRWYLTEETE
jgi:hypothetical protein